MIQQTFLPVKWVIVNDGSTDTTRKIVSRYRREVPLDRIGAIARYGEDRNFAAKVHAFNAGSRESQRPRI